MDAELTTLHEKIDMLANQVGFLSHQLEQQQKAQKELNELKETFMPIANHMIKLSIDELADIGNEFQAEDLLFLVKRLLRNTNNFILLMDRLEGLVGLADETKLLGQQVFNTSVHKLDEFERKGYFELAAGMEYVAEQIVAEFGAEDVRALGDNIVTILKTVRSMTQPEVLSMANQAMNAMQEEPASEELSTWALLKELSDPKVRKGMARMVNMLKVMADQPTVNTPN